MKWFIQHEPDCTMNHDGSSKAMEEEGAKLMFSRSEAMHGLRYTTYLGDGDSSSYSGVVKSRPYGPHIDINKEDCVGHIQKRMGTSLRKVTDTYKGIYFIILNF